MAYALSATTENTAIKVADPALLRAGCSSCCMVCHGELARLKPHPALPDRVLPDDRGRRRARRRVRGAGRAARVFSGYYELPVGLVRLRATRRWRCSTSTRAACPAAGAGRLGHRCRLVAGLAATSAGRSRPAIARLPRHGAQLLRRAARDRRRRPRRPGKPPHLTHGTINHGEQFTRPGRAATGRPPTTARHRRRTRDRGSCRTAAACASA